MQYRNFRRNFHNYDNKYFRNIAIIFNWTKIILF